MMFSFVLNLCITKMSETVSKSFSGDVFFYKSFSYSILFWLSKIKTNMKYKNVQNVIYSWFLLCQTLFTRNFGEVEICLKPRFKLSAFQLNLLLLSQISMVYLLFYYIIWLQQKLVSRGGVFLKRQQSLSNIAVFGTYVGAI